MIIIIITYIYNAFNDALSAYRIHNNPKTTLSKYIYAQNTVLEYLQSRLITHKHREREKE